MDDIVKQLRFGSLTHKGASELNLKAADEIETLRTALAERDRMIEELRRALEHQPGKTEGERINEALNLIKGGDAR